MPKNPMEDVVGFTSTVLQGRPFCLPRSPLENMHCAKLFEIASNQDWNVEGLCSRGVERGEGNPREAWEIGVMLEQERTPEQQHPPDTWGVQHLP